MLVVDVANSTSIGGRFEIQWSLADVALGEKFQRGRGAKKREGKEGNKGTSPLSKSKNYFLFATIGIDAIFMIWRTRVKRSNSPCHIFTCGGAQLIDNARRENKTYLLTAQRTSSAKLGEISSETSGFD